MFKSRTPTWLGLILVPLVAVSGIWVFMTATAPVLHPNPQQVPSVIGSASSPESAAAVQQAQQIVRARISDENLPGLSVAVGIGGDIVWAEGFGFADLRTSALVTPNHRFRIGTASTVLTSAAAGLLLQDGRLKFDDEIQTYVPAFPKKQWPVRLRELMAHTAGMPAGDSEGPLITKHCERPVEALQYFAKDSLRFEPGTQYRYSDYGWILVSAAVEAAASQSFLKFMQERIFDPLEMRNTIPDSAPVEADDDFPLANLVREKIFDPRTTRKTAPDSAKTPTQDSVTPYFPRFKSDPNYGLHLMRPLDFSCYAGSNVFLSTPSDLVRFGMAVNSSKLLQPATVRLLQTSQQLTSGKNTDHGLGWDLEAVTLVGEQTRVAFRDGELLGGMAASLLTFPDYGMVVSVTSNISHAETHSLTVKIAEAFAKQAKVQPVSDAASK